MEKVTLSFSAKGQSLRGCPFRFASNTVNYIEAKFELGENWGGFDSVRAVWFTDFNCISTVLDTDGVCVVPHEVLNKAKREVKVNLVGSIVENGELTDRLTTYPIKAIIIDANAKICGSETAEVTPSQFEQFVEAVKAEVAKIKDIDSVELNDDYTLTIYFSDDTETTVGPIRGEQGPAGPQGEQGETGNGIASIEKTGTAGYVDTYTITFTDGTTTTFEVRNGEVSLETLESLMPIDTANGSIASFPDGQNLFPLKSLVADINPIQDLHGYDAPWVGGAGKNKANIDDSENGGIDANGQNVTDDNNWRSKSLIPIKSGQAYTLHAIGMTITRLYFYDANGDFISPRTVSQTDTVTATSPSNAKYVKWTIYKTGITIADVQSAKVQLEEGSTATTFAPYSNICPISGRTEVVTQRTGKNLIPYPYKAVSGTYSGVTCSINSDGTVNLHGTATATLFIDLYGNNTTSISRLSTLKDMGVNAGDTVTLSGNFTSRLIFQFNKADGTLTYPGSIYSDNGATVTTTIPSDAVYGYIGLGVANGVTINQDNVWFMIQKGSVATSYEPYSSETYTTDLGRTVYGGTLDVVSGELVVDRAMVTLDGTQNISIVNWRPTTSGVGWVYPYSLTNNKVERSDTNMPKVISDSLPTITYGTAYRGTSVGVTTLASTTGTSYGLVVRTADASLTTASAINAYLSNNPITVCYELATPQTIQLTPQEIQTLLGVNNIWADSGDVEVVYIADIKLYVDNH